MCVVSYIADEWNKTIPEIHPWVPNPNTPWVEPNPPTRKEFDDLKREFKKLKKDLKKAKQQDIDEGNADCEMEEKIAFIKNLAKYLGVDLEELFVNGDL